MQVVLVEDNAMLGEAIQTALKAASDAADWVKNGQTALTTLDCQHDDLMLLDLGPPGKDEMDILQRIRAKGNQVPLLIITARDDLDDLDDRFQLLANRHRAAAPGAAKPPLPLPDTWSDGLHTLNVVGEQFRVLVRTKPTGERIAVAQETGVRDEIARDSALRSLMPFPDPDAHPAAAGGGSRAQDVLPHRRACRKN